MILGREISELESKIANLASLGICPRYFHPFGDFCYMLVTEQMGWEAAQTKCRSYNAYLAEPKTAAQNYYVKALGRLFGGGSFWLGATDFKSTKPFTWNHSGQRVNRSNEFSDWHEGEPSNGYIEDCMDIWYNGNYQWNDRRCDDSLAFVCQTEKLRTF